eukprot:6615707-Pyramimonas_sp.AAC.1
MSTDIAGPALVPREGIQTMHSGMSDRAGWEAHQNAYHEAILNRHAALAQMVRDHHLVSCQGCGVLQLI